MDISADKEFIVSKFYSKLPSVLQSIYPVDQAALFEKRIRADWEKKVQHGVSNFVFARRIDLAAPGTRLIGLFSENPRFLSANSWGIRNLSDEDAKILCLWFNSTLFLIEILSKRTPTRGSWGQIDEGYVFSMECVDPAKLLPLDRQALLDLFERTKTSTFPSLMEKLETDFAPRREIDNVFLNLAGIKGNDEQEIVRERMRTSALERIRGMKETMEGD